MSRSFVTMRFAPKHGILTMLSVSNFVLEDAAKPLGEVNLTWTRVRDNS